MRKGCFSRRFPSRGRTVCLTLLCDYVILLLCCPPTSSSLFLFLPEEGRSWNRTRRFPACPVHVPAPRTTSGLSRDNSPFSPTDGERGAAPGNPAPSLHHQRLALQTDPPWHKGLFLFPPTAHASSPYLLPDPTPSRLSPSPLRSQCLSALTFIPCLFPLNLRRQARIPFETQILPHFPRVTSSVRPVLTTRRTAPLAGSETGAAAPESGVEAPPKN